MRLFSLENLKKIAAVLVLIFTYVLTHKNWYLTLDPITFGDIGYLYKENFVELISTLSPTWNGAINFGFSSITTLSYFGFNIFASLLAKMGFGYDFILRIIMFAPIIIGFVASTLVMSKFFKSNSAGLIFGLIFSINTLIIVSWLNLMVAYVFLPVVIFALYKFLRENNFLWLLVTSIFFTIALLYEIRVAFIAFLLSGIFVVSYWVIKSSPKKIFIHQIRYIVVCGVITIFLTAFFTLPLFFGKSFSSISEITSQPLFGTQFYSIQYPLSFMHPFWNGEGFSVFIRQPINFFFWIYPIFAFSALFFARKDKKIIYFAVIALFGIFMGKGASDPFGSIYAWFYNHLPFFNFFREPVQWWVILGFSYAILISYFFYYFYQEIENFVKRKFSNGVLASSFLKVLVTLPVIFVILSIAIPAYDGRLGRGLNPVSFAKDYELLKQFLINDKAFYRTLSIPTNQRFTYYSNNHPYVAYNYVPGGLKSLDTKLLSLEAIRYIILPDDVLTDVFVNSYNKYQYENFIESANSSEGYIPLKRVAGFGNIKLWENPNDSPHLMAVKDLVYIAGSQKISDLVGIPTSKQVAYYSEQFIPPEAAMEIRDMIKNTNDTMYKNATKAYFVAGCIRCDLSKKYYDYVQFPFARFLPDNLLYPLIEIKENRTLSSLASVEEKFKMDAFFGEKRAVEIQAMKKNPLSDKKHIISTFTKANKLIDDMEEKFNKINNQIVNNAFLTTADYLYTQIRTYDDLYQEESDKEVAESLSKITYRLDTLAAKLSQNLWVTEDNKKKLIANLPEEGNYKILLKNDDEVDLHDAELIANGKKFQKASIADNGFLSYGNHQLNEGEYLLELDIPSVNLLELPSVPSEISETNNLKIRSLKDPLSQYQLSFDYKVTGGRAARFFISDDRYPVNSNPANGNLIVDKTLVNKNDEEWHHFNIFFSPYTEIQNPVLHLKDEGVGSRAVFRNLSLVKVIYPTIVFARDTGKVLDTPKITYQEISSTDYTIKIENANKPFLLSFSEQFDDNWTILSTKKQNFYGNLTTTKYFGGSVEEAPYANRIEPAVLVPSLTSEGKVDALHMRLNSFSNGWFVNKTGNYQIHLTFSPQKYFLIGLIVSALTLITILLTIAFIFLKKKKELA